VRAGELNRQITILARQVTKDPVYNTDIIAWVEVKKVWAQVMEMLPSDAEQVSDNVLIATRPSKIIIRWRDDFTSANRIILDGKQMRIVAGPAMVGLRVGLEFVAQELSTEGQEQ
jgi:SPP1 family predicted phage head-tail adaptor